MDTWAAHSLLVGGGYEGGAVEEGGGGSVRVTHIQNGQEKRDWLKNNVYNILTVLAKSKNIRST